VSPIRLASFLLCSLIAFGVAAQQPVPLRRFEPRELSAAELPAVPRGKMLILRSAVFDPTAEVPDFAAKNLPTAKSGEYGIVQFHAGQTGAKEELEREGVQFYGYLPDNAFQVKLTAQSRAALNEHAAVRWLGDYEPGFKVAPKLWPGSDETATDLTVVLFPEGSIDQIITFLASRFSDVWIAERIDDSYNPYLRVAVPYQKRDEVVRALASADTVSWIEPFRELHFHNVNSSGPIQGGVAGDAGRTIFQHGLTGSGQIVAVADSGVDVDSCFFTTYNGRTQVTEATSTTGSDPGPLFPDRKIIGYWVQPGAQAYDNNEICDESTNSFHGTHTSGSAVGDNPANPSSRSNPGVDPGDGMAPNAQLLFQDIGANDGCLVTTNQEQLFLQALRGGARIHSDSYGADNEGIYTNREAVVDRFLFDNDVMAVFLSAGNNGPGNDTIGSPAAAKNAVTVGAVGNGTSVQVTSFSSRGFTADSRIKPDIVAPGNSIISAGGNTQLGDNNCGTASLSGTSMSTPTVAGGAALMRQYFVEGFYPSGAANAADVHAPSASLIKAALLNGTTALPAGGEFGGRGHGWGKIFLDNNLFFTGDSRELRQWDIPNGAGMRTGQTHSYTVTVAAGQEFRATLTWADAEATLGAAVALVNNLDLTVSNGTETFRGNVFNTAGESVSGGQADGRNNVEHVRFSAPVAGTYTITVTAANVPGTGRARTNRQGYALVASFATCATGVTGVPDATSATANATQGIDLAFSRPAGATTTQIYRSNGSCANATADSFRYIGSSNGTTFTDPTAQGGLTYAYRFRGADNCGEGPVSSGCVSTTATGLCDVSPSFAGILAATVDGSSCKIDVSWPAATSNCANTQGVRYRVYRSTNPDFVPSGEPLAVVEGTSFTDVTVVSGVTYYYTVRAEDRFANASLLNTDGNTKKAFATAAGAPGAAGIWRDDAGDNNAFVTAEDPWAISTLQARNGTHSYRTAQPGAVTHSSNICASLITPPLVLEANAELRYSARWNLEHQWDGVVVEISTDNGATWTNLPPDGGYPDSLAQTRNPPINACGYPASQGAFTGPSGNAALTPWADFRSSLSAHAGRTVRIRWRFTTDPGVQFDGFFLDDISVTNVKLPGACAAVTPQANFEPSSRVPVVGVPVTFSDLTVNGATSWAWQFGDSGTSTLQNPTHTYNAPGRYTVTLTATNASGSNTITREIFVSDPNTVWVPRIVVPGLARAQGSAGSLFRTAMWISNLTGLETAVRIRYVVPPGAPKGGADDLAAVGIGPGRLVAFRDLLTEALGADANTTGIAVIEVPQGSPDPIVTARTYNEPGNVGTFGQYIPGVSLATPAPTSAIIEGLGGDTAFRTNVGVVNLTDTEMSATISVFDGTGVKRGNDVIITVAARSAIQTGAINLAAGAGSLSLFSVRITGTQPFFAYASKLDNITSDPIFVPSTLVPQSRQYIDGVAAAPGNGTTFRSNLAIANRGTAPANVNIKLTARGENAPSSEANVTVAPGTTRYFADVITELFNRSVVGTLLITTDPSTPVIAWARTFSDRGAAGTLGQFIPGFAAEDLIGTRGAILQGLSENPAVRTNVGLINTSSAEAAINVKVFSGAGTLVGERTYNVAGGGALQVGRIIRDITGADLSEGYLIVTPSIGNAFYAWASYVDNISTDQTFVRPIPVP
jgi:PKD repeat protein